MTNRAIGYTVVLFSVSMAAAGPTPFNLASLNGTNGFLVVDSSAPAWSRVGQQVVGLGDINADGRPDMAVVEHGTTGFSGKVAVIFGRVGGFPAVVDTATFLNGSTGFVVNALPGMTLSSAAGRGDFNGDGRADLLIGINSGSGNNRAFLFFGHSAPHLPSYSVSDADVTFSSGGQIESEGLGSPMVLLDDVVGEPFDPADDGMADAILGAGRAQINGAGGVYVVAGRASPSSFFNVYQEVGNSWYQGSVHRVAGKPGSRVPYGKGLGTVQWDNIHTRELVVSSEFTLQNLSSGAVSVLAGPVKDIIFDPYKRFATQELQNDTVYGWHFDFTSGHLGTAVSSGDLNNDGREDLILGNDSDHRTYIALNVSGGSPTIHTVAAGSSCAAVISDRTGDGFKDLLLGNSDADLGPDGTNQGEAYFLTFRSGCYDSIGSCAETEAFYFEGKTAGDELGFSGDNVGDLNGDGREDIAIAAPTATLDHRTGEVYVVFDLSSGPLLASIGEFSALPLGNELGSLVTWTTLAEIDNVGFNLYRVASGLLGTRVQLNAELIPAQGADGAGATYQFIDAEADRIEGNFEYYLEDIDLRGTRTLHGPADFNSTTSSTPDWMLY